ncbi:MAG: hypothetical protein R3A10_15470 [Caldilineaceae bacterium]
MAVNPFLGMADYDFAATARTDARRRQADGAAGLLRRSHRGRSHHSRRPCRRAYEADHVAGAPHDVESLRAFAATPATDAAFALTPTVVDAAQQVTGRDWSRLATESISAGLRRTSTRARPTGHPPGRPARVRRLARGSDAGPHGGGRRCARLSADRAQLARVGAGRDRGHRGQAGRAAGRSGSVPPSSAHDRGRLGRLRPLSPLGGRVGRPVRQHAGRVAGRPPGLGVGPLQCLHAGGRGRGLGRVPPRIGCAA